MHAVDFSLSVI